MSCLMSCVSKCVSHSLVCTCCSEDFRVKPCLKWDLCIYQSRTQTLNLGLKLNLMFNLTCKYQSTSAWNPAPCPHRRKGRWSLSPAACFCLHLFTTQKLRLFVVTSAESQSHAPVFKFVNKQLRHFRFRVTALHAAPPAGQTAYSVCFRCKKNIGTPQSLLVLRARGQNVSANIDPVAQTDRQINKKRQTGRQAGKQGSRQTLDGKALFLL